MNSTACSRSSARSRRAQVSTNPYTDGSTSRVKHWHSLLCWLILACASPITSANTVAPQYWYVGPTSILTAYFTPTPRPDPGPPGQLFDTPVEACNSDARGSTCIRSTAECLVPPGFTPAIAGSPAGHQAGVHSSRVLTARSPTTTGLPPVGSLGALENVRQAGLSTAVGAYSRVRSVMNW